MSIKELVGIVAALIFVIIGACSMTTVDTGHRGVKVRFGEVIGDGLTEGLYFVNPFTTRVVEMDTRILKWAAETQAYTKDVQQATLNFTVTYRLDPTKATTIYQSVGTDWAGKLLGQVVNEQLKRVIGQYEAVTLVSKRDEAARMIEADITQQMALRHVTIAGFQLTNVDYTKEFEHAVEAKVVAIQNAIAEQNRTVQVKEKATQTVLAAEAEAQSMRIRANALEANAKLVEWEAVQKWNGQLPTYMLGSSSVPFINIK